MIVPTVQMMNNEDIGDVGIITIRALFYKSRSPHTSIYASLKRGRSVHFLISPSACYGAKFRFRLMTLKNFIIFTTKKAFLWSGYIPATGCCFTASLRAVFDYGIFIYTARKLISASQADPRLSDLIFAQVRKALTFIGTVVSHPYSIIFNKESFSAKKAGCFSGRRLGVVKRRPAINRTISLIKMRSFEIFSTVFAIHGFIIQTNISMSR